LISEPARDSEPVRDRKREAFSAKPEIIVHPLLRDLKNEDFSARLEAKDSEPVKALVMPLVSEAVREDLNSELCPATPEPRFQVAVRWVEQERGLELQVNCPEFTLATMLAIVNMIEAASVLRMELFLTMLEAKVSEPLSDLKIEDFSAKVDAKVSEPLSDLKIEDFSAKVDAKVSEPLRL